MTKHLLPPFVSTFENTSRWTKLRVYLKNGQRTNKSSFARMENDFQFVLKLYRAIQEQTSIALIKQFITACARKFCRFPLFFISLSFNISPSWRDREVHFAGEKKESFTKRHIPSSLSFTGAFHFQSGECWKLIIVRNSDKLRRRDVSDNCY
jgi:hypothetical protein